MEIHSGWRLVYSAARKGDRDVDHDVWDVLGVRCSHVDFAFCGANGRSRRSAEVRGLPGNAMGAALVLCGEGIVECRS